MALGDTQVAGQKVKRKRTTHSKLRTGCGTCKIRHIRCDEETPLCKNCYSTGRVCDGYNDLLCTKQMAGQGLQRVFRATGIGLLPSPSTSIFANGQEAQGFLFFEHGTALQLANCMNDKEWLPLALQFCHHHSGVRHIMVALGFLGRKFEIDETSANGRAEALQFDEIALRQYLRAVNSLRQLLCRGNGSVPLRETVLLSCLLFALYEFLRGNAASFRIHLRSGIEIAQNLPRMNNHGLAHPSGDLEDHLVTFLDKLDMGSVVWLNLTRALSDSPLIYNCLFSLPLPTLEFTLDSAGEFLTLLDNDILTLRQKTAMWYGPYSTASQISLAHPDEAAANLRLEKAGLEARIQQWYSLFSSASDRDLDSAPTTVTAAGKLLWSPEYTAMLRANYLVTSLTLGAIAVPSSATGGAHTSTRAVDLSFYANNEPQFQLILSLVKSSLATPGGQALCQARYDASVDEEPLFKIGLLPIFSLRMGFIRPLFFVASKAPSACARAEALTLLLSRSWREGAWNSTAMGLLAQNAPALGTCTVPGCPFR